MRAFIDSIESQMAKLLLGEDEKVVAYLPTSILPPDAREGTVLQLSLRIDDDATRAGKEEVQTIYDSLGK